MLITFILFLNVRTYKTFSHHIINFHQNIKFIMEEESNGELTFVDTLLTVMDILLKFTIASAKQSTSVNVKDL